MKLIFIVLIFILLGFCFYYFKIRKSYLIEFPEILTEKSCMKILEIYQPNISSEARLVMQPDENCTFSQVDFNISDGLLLNGKRTITFTYSNQQFEGCNIMDTYTMNKLTKEPNFIQFFDCKNLDCKDIKCDERDARFFYTYRKINDYYELKYYMKEPTSNGNIFVTLQFLYFNRPLDEFIKHRGESVCTEE